jgi:peptide-methionine (R)-S-oxide reductase
MDKVKKTPEQWREQLSPEAYHITREAGTEPPHSGRYNQEWGDGIYRCICCDLPLFKSDSKFNAGCGWPSFFEPLEGANLVELEDRAYGHVRTEIRCSGCDAHLGHVFTDGPKPTGLRYCLNSVALNFSAEAPD